MAVTAAARIVAAAQTAGIPRFQAAVDTRPAAVSGGGLVVRLSGGRRSIEVPRGFDEDDMRRLVTALESC